MSVTTSWIKPAPIITGLDHLGTQAPSVAIYAALLPDSSISNIQRRIGPENPLRTVRRALETLVASGAVEAAGEKGGAAIGSAQGMGGVPLVADRSACNGFDLEKRAAFYRPIPLRWPIEAPSWPIGASLHMNRGRSVRHPAGRRLTAATEGT